MRAVVLSNSKVIQLLNKHYVNVFLVLKFTGTSEGAKGDQASKLAARVIEAYEKTITQPGSFGKRFCPIAPVGVDRSFTLANIE